MNPQDTPQPRQFNNQPAPSLALYRRIATLFIVLTVVIVGLVTYMVLSRAAVVVLSKQETVQGDFVFDVAPLPGEGEIPGVALELTDELNQRFPATSMSNVEAKAEGTVRISSSLSRNQTLVATTRLLTPDGVLFRIKKTVTVPAQGSVEVEAAADEPGPSGDVGETSFTIPGLLPETQRYFQVETATPMSGGLREVKQVTQEDLNSAAQVLQTKLEESLAAALREEAAQGGYVGEILEFEVMTAKGDLLAGSEAEEFGMAVEVRASGVFYDQVMLDKLLVARITDLVPVGRQLVGLEEAATMTLVEMIDTATGRANLRTSAIGLTILSPDSPALDRQKITGVSAEAAKKYLEEVDGVSSASIKLSPFWTKRMPNIAKHIKVEVR